MKFLRLKKIVDEGIEEYKQNGNTHKLDTIQRKYNVLFNDFNREALRKKEPSNGKIADIITKNTEITTKLSVLAEDPTKDVEKIEKL